MQVLQINNTDLKGKRFNGYDLIEALKPRGISVKQCVWERESKSPEVFTLTSPFPRVFQKFNLLLRKVENRLSIQALLYPYPLRLLLQSSFWKSDVVHYHLIHNWFFSLFLLPVLSWLKPSVWTIHDPWAVTGHCIYPKLCERWKTGCGKCPDLDTFIPMRRDHTALMWQIKRILIRCSRLRIIVASEWMKNLVSQSPIFKGKKIEVVPFGIDLKKYSPGDVLVARKKLGIDPQTVVILFRATTNEFKGMDYVRYVLRNLKTEQKITLLTLHDKKMLAEFKGLFQVVELGWVNDPTDAYHAADFLLMPSTAEAFGLMAIEAMACGKPVVTFAGTSLVEISGEAGVSALYQDARALLALTQQMVENKSLREQMGKKGRQIAEQKYDEKLYLNRLENIYRQLAKSA